MALTDQSNSVQGGKTLREPQQNVNFYGHSREFSAHIRDGLGNMVMVGERYCDPNFSQDGEALYYWHIGSPQVANWTEAGSVGTNFSELVGTTAAPLNARLIAGSIGHVNEISFGGFHPSTVLFCFADGSFQTLMTSMDQSVYQALGSRAGGEVSSWRQ